MVEISYLELKKMVDFLYSMNYSDDMLEEAGQQTEQNISLLQLHTRMFALGDRYDIPTLRDAAIKKYSSRCAASWEPIEFLQSIYDVYGSTAGTVRQLRDAICTLARKNLPRMLEDDDVASIYDKVATEVPEFTRDLLKIYIKAPLYGNCSTCGSNQAMEALQARCMQCGKGRSGYY